MDDFTPSEFESLVDRIASTDSHNTYNVAEKLWHSISNQEKLHMLRDMGFQAHHLGYQAFTLFTDSGTIVAVGYRDASGVWIFENRPME